MVSYSTIPAGIIYNPPQIIFTECMIIILCHDSNYVSTPINLIQHTPNVARLLSPIWRLTLLDTP